jgi:lipopolysaccharide transport system ATP-binding protein
LANTPKELFIGYKFMAYINLFKANVDIPIYNIKSRSFKNKLIKFGIGNKLSLDDSGCSIVHALKNIDLKIKEGDRVGLVGTNGAGKTSMLRLLNGVYPPTSGQVLSEGKITSFIDLSLGIDPDATGIENIYIRGSLLGILDKEINKNIDEIISFSELDEFIYLPVRTYSSGMLLRLAFSISAIVKPDILLMDEWLSVGDEKFNKKVQSRLHNIIQNTKIIVIASHSREMIENTCNRVLWFENGSIKKDGDAVAVCSEYFLNK